MRRAPRLTREQVAGDDDEMLFIDDCDSAIIGRGDRCGQPSLAVYDYDLLVHAFMRLGMDRENAEEWIAFNVAGSWVGDHTPIIVYVPRGD